MHSHAMSRSGSALEYLVANPVRARMPRLPAIPSAAVLGSIAIPPVMRSKRTLVPCPMSGLAQLGQNYQLTFGCDDTSMFSMALHFTANSKTLQVRNSEPPGRKPGLFLRICWSATSRRHFLLLYLLFTKHLHQMAYTSSWTEMTYLRAAGEAIGHHERLLSALAMAGNSTRSASARDIS